LLRLYSPGVSTLAPLVPLAGTCPSGYRYVELEHGVEDFVVFLGESGEDADEALMGSQSGVLTLERPSTTDHLTITRTFHPPDTFNLLFLSLVVHGPPFVTVVVDSAQDPLRETVSFTSFFAY